MKRLLIICIIACLGASCKKENTLTIDNGTEIDVVLSGGYETVASDGGRPTILIAAALGVTQAKFQEAFSGVSPAKNGQPTTAEELANKAALLKVLAPLGITNDRLDEVSGYYRYFGASGEVWTRVQATAKATVVNGIVTKITLVKGGSGYSSVPLASVPGSTSKIAVTLAYSTDFASNGRISALTVQ